MRIIVSLLSSVLSDQNALTSSRGMNQDRNVTSLLMSCFKSGKELIRCNEVVRISLNKSYKLMQSIIQEITYDVEQDM